MTLANTTEHDLDSASSASSSVSVSASPASALAELTLGATAGLRSAVPAAALAWDQWRRGDGGKLGHPVTLVLTTLAAAFELTADKTPFVPSRLAPGPLAGRALSGAWAGGSVARQADRSVARGALYGAVGAVAASFGGYHLRRVLTRRFRSGLAVALAEDAVAVGIAALAVATRRRAPHVRHAA